jgi:hypothetical protein
MKLKTILLGATAGLLVCGSAAAQSATTTTTSTTVKTVHHHYHHRAMAAPGSVDARIDALEAEIHELRAAQSGQAQGATSGQGPVSPAQFEALQNQVYETQAAVHHDEETIASGGAGELRDKKIHFKGITLQLGGFLAAESVYRSKSELADISSTYSGIPYGNSALGHADEFRMTARQSRISGLIEGNIDPDTHFAVYGEFDFLGAAQTANSNESNSYTPRIRNLYGTIDWDDSGFELLAGQNWSLATLTTSGMSPRSEAPPPTIDAQYVPGFDWTRQPQVRVTKKFGDNFWIGVSAENAATTFCSSSACTIPAVPGLIYNGSPGSGFDSANTLSLNHMPDFIGKVAWEGFDHNVHLEAFGIMRNFYDRYGTDPLLTNVSDHSKNSGGFGAAALIKLIPGVFDIQADAMFGDGIGRYGSGQLADVTFKPTGELAPLHEEMEMIGATWHVTSGWDFYAFGGREHDDSKSFDVGGIAYGYGNPLYNNAGCNSLASAALGCVGDSREIDQITAGTWFNAYSGDYGKARLGLQYSYTERKAFEGVGGAPKTADNMVFTSIRFYPF